MRIMLRWFVSILCLIAAGKALAQDQPASGDAILGVWLTAEGKAKVEITKSSETYSGKLVWLKEPEEDGKPKVDKKNPDEKLRTRPILGMEIMHGFTFDGEDEWVGGRVYDPEDGKEYQGKMVLVDDKTLKLRGYVLIPLLGRSEIWTR